MSDSDLSVDPIVEPATPEPEPEIPAPEPQPVDATGQPIPTPEPTDVPEATPEPDTATLTFPPGSPGAAAALSQGPPRPVDEVIESEVVTPGLAMAAPAYKPPAADFEHTAFNPENVQNIS